MGSKDPTRTYESSFILYMYKCKSYNVPGIRMLERVAESKASVLGLDQGML